MHMAVGMYVKVPEEVAKSLAEDGFRMAGADASVSSSLISKLDWITPPSTTDGHGKDEETVYPRIQHCISL